MGQHITPMISTKFKDLVTETLEVSDSATVTHKLDADEIDVNNLTAGSADIDSATIQNLSLPDLNVGNSITAGGDISGANLNGTNTTISGTGTINNTVTNDLRVNGNGILTGLFSVQDVAYYGSTFRDITFKATNDFTFSTYHLRKGTDNENAIVYQSQANRYLQGTISFKCSTITASATAKIRWRIQTGQVYSNQFTSLSNDIRDYAIPQGCIGIELYADGVAADHYIQLATTIIA